jgi:hypothetical protein
MAECKKNFLGSFGALFLWIFGRTGTERTVFRPFLKVFLLAFFAEINPPLRQSLKFKHQKQDYTL